MRYYLIAGEPSGDLHGSNLMKGILKEDPEAAFRFWGGDLMAGVGGSDNLAKHYRETSFFGIAQVLRNLGTILGQMAECRKDIERFHPDVLILIDYPSFNMRIARWAHSHGIRVFYYIAPKVWAWKEFRVNGIRKYVERLYIIFPFEKGYFARKGIDAVFCGNPLVDAISDRMKTLPPRDRFIRENGLDERPKIALLAGSRRNEIRENLPDMVSLAAEFPRYEFIVTGVSWIDRSIYDDIIGDSGVRYVCDRTYETLAASEAAVVTSGTATLETALLNVPEMVLYHIPRIYEIIKPYVLKVPYVSLVNLNLGHEAVREIISSHFDVAKAKEELSSILEGGVRRGSMLDDFARLRAIIGGEGASARFAADMVGHLKNDSER